MRRLSLTLSVLLTLTAAAAARPQQQTTETTTDDATLTLTLLEETIEGDARSFCEMRIVDAGVEVPLTEGDVITLWLSEDDTVGDDDIFEETLTVTAAEAEANALDRIIDCSTGFGADINRDFEFYARAEVQKEECGFWCLYDRPRTDTMDVRTVEDDDWEDNDNSGAVDQLSLGFTPDFISVDQDWFTVTLIETGILRVDVEHTPRAGRLEVDVFDLEGARRGTGEGEAGRTVMDAGPLEPGEYHLRVTPRDGQDYNFYDLALRLETEVCVPGAVERVPCAHCGWQTRFCQADQRWGEFGECEGIGICDPGDTRQLECGRCGIEEQVCSEECFWEPGTCSGEGECRPGETFQEACDDAQGRRERACDSACFWSEWSPCVVDECQTGETRECYSGPVGTAGVGACARGTSTCDEGTWGACEDQILPRNEICDDKEDNDCDGDVDAVDRDCGGDVDVGDLCHFDQDCGELMVCVIAPEHPGFHEGDCSFLDCDGDCPDGSACGVVLGVQMCLKRCGVNSDCRPDHVCADAQTDMGGLACIPRCLSDEDCLDPNLSRCDVDLGLCLPGAVEPVEDEGVVDPVDDAGLMDAEPDAEVEDATPLVDRGTSPPPLYFDGGPRLDTDNGEEEGCGCGFNGGHGPAALWPLLLVLLIRPRRRGPGRG